MGGSNLLDFSVGDRTGLDSSVRWHEFRCCLGCRKWLHFSVLERYRLGFCVAVEHNFFQTSGSKYAGFVGGAIEVDMIFEWGKKASSFEWRGRNQLDFYVWNRNGLGFIVGSNLTCFLCGGQSRLRFCVRAENDFFLAWGSKSTWFIRRIELELVSV